MVKVIVQKIFLIPLITIFSTNLFPMLYTKLNIYWEKDEGRYKFMQINPLNEDIYLNNWAYFIEIYKKANGYYKFCDILSIKNKEIKNLIFHPKGIFSICITKEDELLILNNNNEVINSYKFDLGEIKALSFSPKGNFLLIEFEECILLTPLRGGKIKKQILKKFKMPYNWDENENFIFYEEKKLKILNTKDLKVIDLFEVENLTAFSFDKDKNVVFGNSKGEIFKYEKENNEFKNLYKLYDKPISKISFNFKGDLIIICNNTNLLNIFYYPKFSIYYQAPFSDILLDFFNFKGKLLILKFYNSLNSIFDIEKKNLLNIPRYQSKIFGDINKKKNIIYAVQSIRNDSFLYKFDLISGKVLGFSKLQTIKAEFLSLTPDDNFLMLFFKEGFSIIDISKGKGVYKKTIFTYNPPKPKIFYNNDVKKAFISLSNDSFAILNFPSLDGFIGYIEPALSFDSSIKSFKPLGWFMDKFYGFYYYPEIKKLYLLKVDNSLNIEKKEIIEKIKWISIIAYEESGENVFLKVGFEEKKYKEEYAIFSLAEEKFKYKNEINKNLGFITSTGRAPDGPDIFLPKSLFNSVVMGRFDFESYVKMFLKPKKKKIEILSELLDGCGTGFISSGSRDIIKFKGNFAILFSDNVICFKVKRDKVEENINFKGIKDFRLSNKYNITLELEKKEFYKYFKGNLAICSSNEEGKCKESFIVKMKIPINTESNLVSIPYKKVNRKYLVAKWEIFKDFYIGEDNEIFVPDQSNKLNYLTNLKEPLEYRYNKGYSLCKYDGFLDIISAGGNYIITRCKDGSNNEIEVGYNLFKFEDGKPPYFLFSKVLENNYLNPQISRDGSFLYYFDFIGERENYKNRINVFSIPDMKLIYREFIPKNKRKTKMSEDGKNFILCDNEFIKILNFKEMKEISKIEFPWWSIKGIELSPCKDKVAIFSLKDLYIYNINGEFEYKIELDFVEKDPYYESFYPTIEVYTGYNNFDVNTISFSPDCKKIAALVRGYLVIFDLESKKIERVYKSINPRKIFWDPKSKVVFLLDIHDIRTVRYYIYNVDLNVFSSISFEGHPLKWISEDELMTTSGVFKLKN